MHFLSSERRAAFLGRRQNAFFGTKNAFAEDVLNTVLSSESQNAFFENAI
jgi:hypothetical protein